MKPLKVRQIATCLDNFSDADPQYESITVEEALEDFSSYLEQTPSSLENLVSEFTANPDPSIDEAIYSSGDVSTRFEGPAEVTGTMPDGAQWSQSIQYDDNGVYMSPPIVTNGSGETYVDYSSEPVVVDSQLPASQGDTNVNVDIDLSGVEQRLDEIIENTEPEPIPVEPPLSLPTEGARSFYESEYPDGFNGVWTERYAQLQQTALFEWVDQFRVQFTGGEVPSWEFCFNLGDSVGNYGCRSLILDSRIWAAIRIFVIFCSGLLARKLVFGG